MLNYLIDYIALLLIFIMDDVFLFINPMWMSALKYLPTLNLVGNFHVLIIIPYTYLIVRLLFIRKADKEGNINNYINIRKKLIIVTTIINIIFLIVEALISNNTFIWIVYTIIFLIFMLTLKPKQEVYDNLMKKNIKKYMDQ